MRFSLYYNPTQGTLGGAHTYIESLLGELVSLVDTTPHELIVFGIGSDLPEWLKKSSVRFIDLRRAGGDAVIALWLAGALRRWRWHPFLGIQRLVEYYMQARLGSILRKNGVQFLWSLSPFVHTMEIPYAITMWDIQHRLQGFFPEVSNQGEWRERERRHMEMMSRAVYVIATNVTGKKEIVENFIIPAAKVIPLPLFTPQWALAQTAPADDGLAERFGLKSGEFLFYPAQLWAHKNHIRIIEALDRLKAHGGRQFKAVFVGHDYGNRDYLQERAKASGLESQIVFPGFVSQAQLCWLYRNAFCLVFPSMFGAENLPPLEAFALECPVICAKYDGAQEQLADAALLFDPTNAEDLARKIRLLDSPGLREELCLKGSLRCRLWTPRQYAEKIFSLLDDFAALRRCWP